MLFPQHLCRHLSWFTGVVLAILLLVQPVSMADSIDDQVVSQRGWIRDRAELLDWQTESDLSLRINKLVGRTSAELAIVTLPQVETGISPHALALRLFNALGIGKSDSNNGVLLLVSKNDRRVEIITGTGLGEILPNAEISGLIQQEIVPAFRQQQYATGITQGVMAIAQRLEARLPRTIFPSWMPSWMTSGLVWGSWVVAIGGLGCAIFFTVQVLVISFTSVQVLVPPQGFNDSAFSSSEILTTYSFVAVLDRVTNGRRSNRDPEAAKIPELMINVLLGGLIFGLGLIYGFWQFVLMHPDAEFWQGDAIAWIVFGVAGSAGWLWGVLVASRFIPLDLLWRLLPLWLLAAAFLAGLGGLFGRGMTMAWSAIGILGMVSVIAILAGGAWTFLIHPHLEHFNRKRNYLSDRTSQPLQELTPQELESLLTPKEILAKSLGKLEFRGWREVELTPPLVRAQVYLVQRIDNSASICAHCKSYAVDTSTQTVERTIETTKKTKKSDRKGGEKIKSVRSVQVNTYSCHFCGSVFSYDRWDVPAIASDSSGSASDSSSSFSSSSNDSYDNNIYNDYGSSSNDFGGGSSDGGGAGSDW
jgi:uncharacterized protein